MKATSTPISRQLQNVVARGAARAAAFVSLLVLNLGAACPVRAGHAALSEPGGTLVNPRYWHTATLLVDGRVLLAGGIIQVHGGFAATNACEIYDPATNTWTATGSLNDARYGHGAVLLSDGRVLVAGGSPYGGSVMKTAEIYNPATGTWKLTGQMLTRRWPELVLLTSGQVLAAGGSKQNATNCELFDPATGKWSVTGSLIVGRFSYRATRLDDGRVLIAGGNSGNDPGFVRDTELYNPATGTWSVTGMLNRARDSQNQVLLANGQVLVAGGLVGPPSNSTITRITEIFDPATGLWTLGHPLTTPRTAFTANLLQDGNVFAAGGTDQRISSEALGSIEEFDPVTGRWDLLSTTLATPRLLHSTTTLLDGSLVIAGGIDGNGKLIPNAELFVTPR